MNNSPLSLPEFYILLTLITGEGHGYNLRSRVRDVSLGGVRLAGGTLYPLLVRMQNKTLIDSVGLKPAGVSGISREHYAISQLGRIALKGEIRRFSHALKIAENNGLMEDDIPLDIQRILLELR